MAISRLTPEQCAKVFAERLNERVGGRELVNGRGTMCPLEYVYQVVYDERLSVGPTTKRPSGFSNETLLEVWERKFVDAIDAAADDLENQNGSWSSVTGEIALGILLEVTGVERQ